MLDIPRVIVMPSDAPAVKRIATEGYGGEVVLYDRDREDREAIGQPARARARAHADSARTITRTSSPARARPRAS